MEEVYPEFFKATPGTAFNRGRKSGRITRLKVVVVVAAIGFLGVSKSQAVGHSVTLAWDPSTSSTVVGYNIYYGQASRAYGAPISVGNVTNTTVSSLNIGVTYYFAATAVDSNSLESDYSAEVAYTVPSNSIPVITLSSPADGASYIAPATINLAANVVTNGHNINSVQFYNGTTMLGQVTNEPYAFSWSNVGAGSYSLSAQALYDGGSAVASSNANVTVVLSGPTVALVSPTDGASFAAPANITLSAAVTNSSHTINAVQFYNGTNLLGAVTNAPYDFAWTNVGVGNYTIIAQTLYDGSSAAQSSPVHISVWSLPPPWQTADIGNAGLAGSAVYSNSLFTVTGAGNLSGRSDQFRFLYQSLSGDGQIVAQIQPGETSGSAGVMIRESLTGASTYTYLGLSAGGTFKWQRRSSTGGRTWTIKTGGPLPPVWVRLGRTNGVFSSYNSADGTNWTFIGSVTIAMAPSAYIGLAVASGQTNVLNTAQFGDVGVDLSNIGVAGLSPTLR